MMVVVRKRSFVEINPKLNSELGRGFGYRVGPRVFPFLVQILTPQSPKVCVCDCCHDVTLILESFKFGRRRSPPLF